MPRRTDIAALALAAVVIIASTVLAVSHNPVPAVFPILAVALVTGALGIAQPPAMTALLEKLAEGLTPAPPEPDVSPSSERQLAAQLIANAINQQAVQPGRASVTVPVPSQPPATP